MREYYHVARRARRYVARSVLNVELASTGDIDMSRWLVCSRVQAEVEHEGSEVFWCVNVGSAKGVWKVISEELGLEGREDVDSMRLELERVNSLSSDWVDKTLGCLLGREGLVLGAGGVEGHGVVNHDISKGSGVDIDYIVSHEGESVPVSVLVDITDCDVDCRPKPDEHGLDWPLELGE